MKKLGMALAVAAALAGPAQAIVIDSQGDTGILAGAVGGAALVIGVDGGILQGVGNAKTFLSIQGAGTERGYNTSGLVEFQTIASGTTPLLLSEVPHALNSGTEYLEFAYSLNQEGGDPAIAISRILVFQTNTPSLTGFTDGATPTIGGNTNLIFAWSAANSGQTLTVQDFVSGQSNTELLLLIRAANFDATFGNVVLYVEQTNSNDGPDKWVVFGSSACVVIENCEPPPPPPPPPPPGTAPEPMSLALVGAGLLGLGCIRRRRK
jgi:hypothetical protein